MSFRSMLERTVTIVPRVVVGVDGHGNDVIVDGTPIADVPASRDLVDSSEELARRDEQEVVYRYFLPAELDDGTEIFLTGYDRIDDGTEVLEVRGEISRLIRRRGGVVHHLEVIAYKIEG